MYLGMLHTQLRPGSVPVEAVRARIKDPADILPLETLTGIWKMVVADEAESCQRQLTFPFTASWVSHHWRNVALTTPTIWSSVYIDRYSKLEPTKAQLTRSGKCLLDLVIYFVSTPDEGVETVIACEPAMRDFMDTVSAHADRWRSLQLTIYGARAHHGILPIESALTRLRTLAAPELTDFSFTPCFEYPRSAPLLTGGTPRLSRLRLDGVDLKGLNNLFPHLTSLNIVDVPAARRPSLEEFVALLEACSKLECLTIDGPCFRLVREARDPCLSATLPSLLSLSLSFSDEFWDRAAEEGSVVATLFGTISAPLLQTLVFGKLSHLGAEAVVRAITVTSCGGSPKFPELSRLCLYDVCLVDPYQERDLSLPFLLCFPFASTLELSGGDSRAILGCLASEEWASCHEPIRPGFRLKTLVCPDISCSCDEGVLSRFILGRQAIGHSIAKLWLCGQVEVVFDFFT
ncbi:hypothetical protein GLOTRDRAFT_95488 [Gloeophyllum trabeum ATCC 11539]|uniref:F-box domain-containing protein n=1 Tax=Gloeophyllum trabeum (strain ATCC 11539 / FP-39264 / Madison 617) TaxID=670483 RepID=S7RJ12_GLOTA|nr:uncharacterized protein GLOTRDRAFT_95488 [Gloeophyllum trabeum ATCC 11539]EPQ52609.1 hypothetical protein GLOTRDRAFT_95488 [Gloeophyllum trabeum ATCC 11539]